MSIRCVYEKFLQSELYRLVWEDEVIGLRAKKYNWEIDQFEYYDFLADNITNETAKNFLKEIKQKLPKLKLQEVNGLLASEAEIKNNIAVQELTDTDTISNLIMYFFSVYSRKELGTES